MPLPCGGCCLFRLQFYFTSYIQVCDREDHPWTVIVKLEGEPYNRESYQMVSYFFMCRKCLKSSMSPGSVMNKSNFCYFLEVLILFRSNKYINWAFLTEMLLFTTGSYLFLWNLKRVCCCENIVEYTIKICYKWAIAFFAKI